MSQNYLIGNRRSRAWRCRAEQARPLGSQRTLTFGQWDALEERLDEFSRRAARTAAGEGDPVAVRDRPALGGDGRRAVRRPAAGRLPAAGRQEDTAGC